MRLPSRLTRLQRQYLLRWVATSVGGGKEELTDYPLFNNCQDVLLDGFTTSNSPFWNTHLVYCSNVIVKNTTFQNPAGGINGDGLDIDSCSGVRVFDCKRRSKSVPLGGRLESVPL
jgi:hypothetical protein